MKLLCINSRQIKINDVIYDGRGYNDQPLVEGKEYETKGEIYYNDENLPCYYITGFGLRLARRFTKVIEPTKEEIIWSKKEEFCLN